MENKETIMKIRKIEAVKSKAGREFWSIEAENGDKFSCFEKKIVDLLNENISSEIKVSVAENEQGFKNIRKFIGVVQKETQKPIQTMKIEDKLTDASNADILEARKAKDVSIFTSYAKDLLIGMLSIDSIRQNVKEAGDVSIIMAGCIDLIKQARDSFREI
jgi:NCAIR mutase (PurE)-related protein